MPEAVQKNKKPQLPKLNLRKPYDSQLDSVVMFTVPFTGKRKNLTYNKIKKLGYAAIHKYHLERFFDLTEEQVNLINSTIDADKGLTSKSGYKLREPVLNLSVEDEYGKY